MASSGRVAWVTGGGKGIGRAIALQLAGRGDAVVVTGRDERALGEAVGEIAYQGGRARHLVADVRDPAAMERAARAAVEWFGSLDVVVANAGVSGPSPLAADPAFAADVIGTNLLGTLHAFRAASLVMTGPGRMVAISSVLGKFGVPDYSAYCASKAGIQGLVRALSQELGPRRITVNAVCAGWTETDMAEQGIAIMAKTDGVTPEEARRRANERFPLGRFLDPDEVARFVAFVSGADAGGITGQSLSICGGSTAFGS
jgi:ketoreductase